MIIKKSKKGAEIVSEGVTTLLQWIAYIILASLAVYLIKKKLFG